jgi:hypothetical protein
VGFTTSGTSSSVTPRVTRIRNPHGKGFNREIPLLNVERLCPESTPESAPDVRRAKAALSSG